MFFVTSHYIWKVIFPFILQLIFLRFMRVEEPMVFLTTGVAGKRQGDSYCTGKMGLFTHLGKKSVKSLLFIIIIMTVTHTL